MSLIKCKKCGKVINSEAKYCTYCGKKISGNLFLQMVGILLFIFWIINVDNNNNPSSNTSSTRNIPNNINNTNTEKSVSTKNVLQEENKNNEISKELHKKLSPDILRNIEDLKVEIKDKDVFITTYLKNNTNMAQIIGKNVVQEILNILISKGKHPYDEKITISNVVCKRVKGATGQDMVSPFGTASYEYRHDSIAWRKWGESWIERLYSI